jgi:hypothetical protein
MFGQSPLVINTSLNYDLKKYKINAAIAYNYQAPRLVQTNFGNEPSVYEMPRNLIDLKITKSFAKNITLGLTIRDLLNTAVRRSYKFTEEGGYLVDFERIKFGTNYALTLSYKL